MQESYLNSFEDRNSMDDLERMAEASDMISLGDMANIQIRMNQNWALLPNYGILSSLGPCLTANGRCFYPGFPQYLGKMSTTRKSLRLIRELKQKMSESVHCNKYAIQNEMIPHLLEVILEHLHNGEVKELIAYMESLSLSSEMIKEHLLQLCLGKNY